MEQENIQPELEPTGESIRFRAILLGLAFAVIICAITPFNNAYRQATPLAGGHFPLAPFFILFWLTLIVLVLGKLTKGRQWLTGKELLISWILMVLVSGIAYTGLVRTFFINITAPFRYASVGNRWEDVLQPLIPGSWYPSSPEAIDGLYNGLSGGRELTWWEVIKNIPWDAWIVPLLVWGTFILLCYFVMLCLVNLLSRQWIRNERMNFPLLRVPELFEEATDQNKLWSFLTNPYFIAGLSVPVFIHLINGLSFYFPSVPQVPTLVLAGHYFPKYGLFSGFHKLKIYFYPAFIGFAFLTSRQISLSFWAFFILGGLLVGLLSLLGYNIPAADLGVTFGPALSMPVETQMIGAYLAFFFFIMWLARSHLLDIFKQAFGLKKGERPVTEWFSPRLSFWGVALGLAAIIWWCGQFGLTFWPALLTVGVFFIVTLVASRVVCQGGIAYFSLTAAPMDAILTIFGPGIFSKAGLLVAGMVQKVLFVDLRESLMPSLFHAGKASQVARKNRRMILTGIVMVLVAGLTVSFLAMLVLCYKYGLRELQLDWATRSTLAVHENIQRLIESPVRPGEWVVIFTLAGAVFMLIMVICYHRFYWWPIHPIGYLAAYSSSLKVLWFSIFLGWLSNVICMRYGGVALFKRLRFFFVGLVVGDFLMGGAWVLVGLFSDYSYQVFPD